MTLKSTVLAAALSLVSAICFAGTPDGMAELDRIFAELAGNRIEVDYSFSLMQNEVPVLCSGHAVFQQKYFHISGNGLEIFNDGTTITYMDFEAKEAYVESAVRMEDYIKENLKSVRDLKISNFRKLPESDDLSAFKAPEPGPEWVMTDLR